MTESAVRIRKVVKMKRDLTTLFQKQRAHFCFTVYIRGLRRELTRERHWETFYYGQVVRCQERL